MLSKSGFAIAAIVLCAAVGAAQSTEAEREVRAVQANRLAAVVGQDVDGLEKIMDETLTYGHTTGATDTKASYLDRVRTGSLRYLTIVPHDMKVNVYGETAVVTGRIVQDIQAGQGAPIHVTLRTVEVYVKRADGWKLALFQGVTLPSMPAASK